MGTRKRRRRANGEGTSYYVASEQRWRGALSWTDAEGTRRRRVTSGTTQADVRRALAEIRTGLERGTSPSASESLTQYLAEWLEASRQRVRPSTWRAYQQGVRLYIEPPLGRLAVSKITPTDVERMTAALIASGRSPRTAHTARAILRRALGDAVRDGLVHRNVAALAHPPHVPQRALTPGLDYLDGSDMRRLVAAAKGHPFGPLVTLAATTGLRQGELLGLTWPDIDPDSRTLTVRRSLARSWDGWALAEPKTARSRRTINLPTAAIAALERQRVLQDSWKNAVSGAWQDRDGLVFTDAVGRALRAHDAYHGFQSLLAAAELPSVPFHGLRHSAATAMLAAGVSLKVVSDQLGHSTIVVTADRYAGVVPAQRREAADAMDRTIGTDL